MAYYSVDAVQRATDYILLDSNINVLSQETKKVTVNSKKEILPKLARKEKVETMLVDYRLEYPREFYIRELFFYSIVKTITNEDMKAKTTINYISGVLLHNNLLYIQKMTNTIEDSYKCDSTAELSFILEAWMKKYFVKHFNSDLCSVLSLDYSLNDTNTEDIDCSKSACKTYVLPFRIMLLLREQLSNVHYSMMDNCTLKIKLLMGHCV